MSSKPNQFQDFPSLPTHSSLFHEYNSIRDLTDWHWTYSGHNPPDVLTDGDGGAITLGGTDATDESYLNGQWLGASIKLNRLNKVYEFLWTLSIDSATLCEVMFGLADTNTNLLNTCIANGMGMYANGPSGPATGYWQCFNANGATVQYTHYGGYTSIPTDTSTHTYGMRIITDSTTLGTGSITWWQDGVQLGNGLSGAILSQSALRMSIAMGNGTAAARSLVLYQCGVMDAR